MSFYDVFGLIGVLIIAGILYYASIRDTEKFKEI